MHKSSKWLLISAVLLSLALVIVAVGFCKLSPARASYLKWRFYGGEGKGLRSMCLSGQLDREDVITLAQSGASLQVRMAALQCFREEERFERPLSEDVVEAVAAFAKNPPSGVAERDAWATWLCDVMACSPQDEFYPIVEGLATSEDPLIRSYAPSVFGPYDYGGRGQLLLMKLLEDPVPLVRCCAIVGVAGVAASSEENASDLLDQIRRGILESNTEQASVRVVAMKILWRYHRITREVLEKLAQDQQPEVAQQAQTLLL